MRALVVPLLFSAFFASTVALHWKNNTIPMNVMDGFHPETLRRLHFVVDYIEARTCVRFLFNETTDLQPRLFVNSAGGCCGVGYLYGGQQLNLGPGVVALKGLFHEVGHVLGLSHTQERPDNRLYLNRTDNNTYYPHDTFDRYGMPYDYGSSEHSAGFTSFDPRYDNSMRGQLLSFYDILDVNGRYGCFDNCDDTPKPKCENGGVVNVNNCSKCLCPFGWIGDLCQERGHGNAPQDCGKSITVTDQVQTLEMPVKGQPGAEPDDHTHCYYLLEAPSCKHIQVTIRDLPNECTPECEFIGLELYGNIDKRQTGWRYCCNNGLNSTVTSEYSKMIIDAFSYSEKYAYTFKIDVVAV